MKINILKCVFFFCLLLIIEGCNSGGGSQTAPSYTIGGTVSGLSDNSSLILEDNYSNPITISKNGNFIFTQSITKGGSYHVIVATQPAGKICSVNNGQGVGVNTDINNIKVVCSIESYTISGAVSGLVSGQSLTLINNGDIREQVVMQSNQGFTFNQTVAFNGSYNITILTQPTNEVCTVNNGQGSDVIANINNIKIVCSTDSYTIAGNVSGLTLGQTVTLINNGDIKHPVTMLANGSFNFKQSIAFGGSYNVTVATQPLNEGCGIINGQSTDIKNNVNNIQVKCAAGFLSSIGNIKTGTSPSGIAIAPNGKYVYVTNSTSNSISMYSIGNDGTLTPLTPASVGAGKWPSGIASSPNGKYVYVTNQGDNTISMYNIGVNGVLIPMSPTTIATESMPTVITITPDGKYVYIPSEGDNGTISIYSVGNDGILTGLAAPVVTNVGAVGDIIITANGKYLYFTSSFDNMVFMFDINNTGVLNPLPSGDIPSGDVPIGLISTPDNKFVYVANIRDNTVSMYSIADDGELYLLTPNETVATGNNPSGLAVTPDGKYIYVTNTGDNTISMYNNRPWPWGGLDIIAPQTVPAGNGPTNIAVTPDNKYAYAINEDSTVSMYKILK